MEWWLSEEEMAKTLNRYRFHFLYYGAIAALILWALFTQHYDWPTALTFIALLAYSVYAGYKRFKDYREIAAIFAEIEEKQAVVIKDEALWLVSALETYLGKYEEERGEDHG